MQAKIWNLSRWIDHIPKDEELKEYYSETLNDSGFNVLKFTEYKFHPFGYTALWLLGESHFAVHTFPEEDRYYIELSSCNEKYYNTFHNLINCKLGNI